MTKPLPLSIWRLIDEASDVPDARTIMLSVGKPPMVRVGEEGFRPLDEEYPVVTWKSVTVLLSSAVEPEKWDALENAGEGEVRMESGEGRQYRVSVFKNSDSWSAVVFL